MKQVLALFFSFLLSMPMVKAEDSLSNQLALYMNKYLYLVKIELEAIDKQDLNNLEWSLTELVKHKATISPTDATWARRELIEFYSISQQYSKAAAVLKHMVALDRAHAYKEPDNQSAMISWVMDYGAYEAYNEAANTVTPITEATMKARAKELDQLMPRLDIERIDGVAKASLLIEITKLMVQLQNNLP